MKIPRRVSSNNHGNGETKRPFRLGCHTIDNKKKREKETQERRKSWNALKQSDVRLSPPLIVRYKGSETTSTYLRL